MNRREAESDLSSLPEEDPVRVGDEASDLEREKMPRRISSSQRDRIMSDPASISNHERESTSKDETLPNETSSHKSVRLRRSLSSDDQDTSNTVSYVSPRRIKALQNTFSEANLFAQTTEDMDDSDSSEDKKSIFSLGPSKPLPQRAASSSGSSNIIEEGWHFDSNMMRMTMRLKHRPTFAAVKESPKSVAKSPSSGDGMESDHAEYAFEELLETEKSFLSKMRLVNEHFVKRLHAYQEMGDPLLSEDQLMRSFLNIEQIIKVSEDLLKELKALRKEEDKFKGISKVFKTLSRDMEKTFSFFCAYYDSAVRLIRHLMDRSERLTLFIKRGLFCMNTRNLESLLLEPVQRVMRYNLHLKEMLKFPSNSRQYKSIKSSMDLMQKICEAIDTKVKIQSGNHMLYLLQERLMKGKVSLVVPGRYCIRMGSLSKFYRRKRFLRGEDRFRTYFFVLCNDILFYCSTSNNGKAGILKHVLPLAGMTVKDVDDTKQVKDSWQVTSTYKSFILAAPSTEQKIAWMTDLRKYVENWKDHCRTNMIVPMRGSTVETLIKKPPSQDRKIEETTTLEKCPWEV